MTIANNSNIKITIANIKYKILKVLNIYHILIKNFKNINSRFYNLKTKTNIRATFFRVSFFSPLNVTLRDLIAESHAHQFGHVVHLALLGGQVVVSQESWTNCYILQHHSRLIEVIHLHNTRVLKLKKYNMINESSLIWEMKDNYILSFQKL